MIVFLTLVHVFAMIVKITWTWSVAWHDIADLFGKRTFAATLRLLAAETKPFYLPAVLVYWGTYRFTNDNPGPLWLSALFIALDLTMWFMFRNHNPDDDDRWKRRRKRAVESVKKIGARLVVVPVPSPVPTS